MPNLVGQVLFASGIIVDLIPVIVIGGFVQYVYADVWNVHPTYVSVIWMMFSVVKLFAMLKLGATIDASNLSKATQYVISAFIGVLGFWLLWIPPLSLNNEIITLLWFTMSLFIFAIGSCWSFLIRNALFIELFSAQDRGKVGGIQQILATVGIIVGFVTPPIISDGWRHISYMGNLMTLTVSITLIFSSLGTFLLYTHKRPVVAKKQNSLLANFLEPLKTDRAFAILMFASLASQTGLQCGLAVSQMYIKYMIPGLKHPYDLFGYQLDGTMQVGLAQLIGQIASLVATPLWIKLLGFIGYGRTWALAAFIFAFGFLLQFFFENGTFELFFLVQVILIISVLLTNQ